MVGSWSVVFFFHALRLGVRDAFVAVDARVLVLHRQLVLALGALLLHLGVHALQAVAVAALERVVGLHALPLALGEREALGLELLPGVDGAGDLAPHLAGGLDLADHLVGPLARYVAVRADGAHA